MAEKIGRENSGISFAFKKRPALRKFTDSRFNENAVKDAEPKDYVLSVDENKIQSTLGEKEETELVIPLILKNKWQFPSRSSADVSKIDDSNQSLEAIAAREILQETSKYGINATEENSDFAIPLLIQNKVPEGYETDNKLDVSLRAEESTMEDYDKVPIDKFGLAMLRGMGWKKGDPIGNKNKQVVQPMEAVVRVKGLGLGADLSHVHKQADEDGDNNILSRGSYVYIENGTHKGSFGKIEGFNEDDGRVMIKLATHGKIVTAAQCNISKVTREEYMQKGSNSVKKEHRSDQRKQEPAKRRREDDDRLAKEIKSSKPSTSKRDAEKLTHKKSKYYEESESEEENSVKKEALWICPQIKVRFINKKYKHGRYYNTKVIIIDVIDAKTGNCICRTEEGTLLEDIPSSWFETVIPRHDSQKILVVRGKHTGQVGHIVNKNKSKCVATVQLMYDKDLLTLKYDDICEYVGDANEDD